MKKRLLLSLLLLSGASAFAQTRVTGVVTSAVDGSPMAGAHILDGTKVVAITDAQGRFTIASVPANHKTLTVSYLGMKTQRVDVASNISVALEEDSDLLGEAVITGAYGSGQKVGSVTGAVAVVSSAAIENKPVANIVDAIQGKVAGVSVMTSTGEPSATSSVTIRGVGTLNGSSSPLYILDGQFVTSGTILAINPNDFESVQVLKDASATAIYGSRAANGVIIYTTKRGKRGEAGRIALDLTYSVSNMASTRQYDNMASSQELFNFWRETGIKDASQLKQLSTAFDTLSNFNWRKYVYRENAPTYQATLSYSGGTETTDYFVSLGLLDATGLAYRSHYTRYAFRSTVNTTLRPWLTAGFALSTSYEDLADNPYGQTNLLTGSAYSLNPMYTPYDKEGKEYYEKRIPGFNTYSLRYRRDKFFYDNTFANLIGSVYFELRPIKGLRLRTFNSVDASDRRYTQGRYASHVAALNDGYTKEYFARATNIQSTNTAEYKFTINNDHHVTALMGQEYRKGFTNAFSASVDAIEDDRLILISAGVGTKELESAKQESAALSWFGRVSYDFLERYFFDATLRNDNSSLFSSRNRSGTFFSLGARWKMKEEHFMQTLDWVNGLDLRLSYGTQGRSAVLAYQYLTRLGSKQYQNATSYAINTIGNSDLTWETQGQASIGFDLLALNNRLKVTFDYYDKRSYDLLLAVPQPGSKGFPTLTRNTAELKNTGVELTASYDVFGRASEWFLEPYANFSVNNQSVTKLFDEANGNGTYWLPPGQAILYAVGEKMGFAMPIWAGVNKATGEPQWYLPGDNPAKTTMDPTRVTSVFSEALAQNTGKSLHASINGGFGFDAGYKGFGLQVDFAYQLGKYLMNNDSYFTHNPTQFPDENIDRSLIGNYWTPTNTNAAYPSMDHQTMQFDTRLLQNASFLRLKNITLSYTLPKAWIDKTNLLSSARVYITGRNLLTATGYKGNDPEINENLTMGDYPATKQISVGLNVTF